MVSIISFILGLIILGILYKNMIAWEGVYRISKGQAILPVVLGLSSVPISFIFFIMPKATISRSHKAFLYL